VKHVSKACSRAAPYPRSVAVDARSIVPGGIEQATEAAYI